MRTDRPVATLALLALMGAPAPAQEPLSAIDWLNELPDAGGGQPVLLEPPVSASALSPEVIVEPLDATRPAIGLVSPDRTGLPETLFEKSDPYRIATLIAQVPVARSPAMQSLLYSLLLTETLPPSAEPGAAAVLLARIDRLLDLGAVDPAFVLADLAGARDDPALFARWFEAALLIGDEDRACAVLDAAPLLSEDYAARIVCAARMGDWARAEMQRGAAQALDLLPSQRLDLLDRFLNAELFEDATLLPPPPRMDALAFRIFEAIGERQPTSGLPRAFANADLRDVAGWKAQIEAAERLVRSGAMDGNRLLGLYTARDPAASGGVWDRVDALQAFEAALDLGDAQAIARTLPVVWDAMQTAGAEMAFADLFADRLAAVPLQGPDTRALVTRIRLLSAGYRDVAAAPDAGDAELPFLRALATGRPDPATAPDPQAMAIAEAFADPAPVPEALARMIDEGRTGEAILLAMIRYDRGAEGNLGDLTAALATFHALGLDDVVRRAALQLRLLERLS